LTSVITPASAPRSPARSRQRNPALSDREQQVLALIAEGHPNGKIGRELHVSEHTVKTHVRHIMRKLGARSRTHVVTMAYRLGYLSTQVSDEAVTARPGGSLERPRMA
jgi:DNA-binding NarL/FixJ family response regulator